MTKQKYETIDEVKIDDVVDYGFFSNVTVVGFDEKHVEFKFPKGGTKRVFKELFLKYAR